MAVDLIQLAAAVRLGDGELAPTEPVAGLLSRLLGVSQAFVAIAAPEAPEAIADEATIRMTAYLYDAPTSASGDRYAAGWRNSGAEALVSRWVVRRAGSEGEGVPTGGPGGGLDDDQVRAIVQSLLEEHAELDTVHHTPPTDSGGGQDVIDHNAADDAHEDIREAVEETAQRLIDGAGHASNVDLGRAGDRIDTNRDNLTTHEGTPHGGGTDQTARDAAAAAQATADANVTAATAHAADANVHHTPPTGGETPTPTPTPPAVLVDAVVYSAHGDVTAAGWRDYDFVQLFYAVGGTTYMTPAINTVQLVGLSPLLFGMSRNVAWTLAISTTDDDVINVTQAVGGNTVPAPTATSTMTVIAWRS